MKAVAIGATLDDDQTQVDSLDKAGDKREQNSRRSYRRAKAGKYLLDGTEKSLHGAMIRAGYSPATAHNAKSNGVTVKGAIRDAVEVLEDDSLPSLVRLSRKRMREVFEYKPLEKDCWKPAPRRS